MRKQAWIAAVSAAAIVATVAIPMAATAATTIAIDKVQQRWPWNNKVDITYTIQGGQDAANGEFYKIVFTTVINGTTYTIDGVSDVGASANEGTHTVTWETAPEGVKNAECTMSAAVYAADVPSGDDYLVIDLATGALAYEGLLGTGAAGQSASEARYNQDVYKTDKLVLRRIPRTAKSDALPNGPFADGYPTGDNTYFTAALQTSVANRNTERTWTNRYDYYIGVYPVTQAQYKKLGLENPSTFKTSDNAGNASDLRPVETVSWNDLRASTAADEAIPAVANAGTGSFLQRLNCVTGNRFAFDLPTEVMFEIAVRAGSAGTTYFWGEDPDQSMVVCSGNSGKGTVAVGSKPANAWGLHDIADNVWELCLDVYEAKDMAQRPDAFTPYAGTHANRRRRGGNWGLKYDHDRFRASNRDSTSAATGAARELGFRVSMIVK